MQLTKPEITKGNMARIVQKNILGLKVTIVESDEKRSKQRHEKGRQRGEKQREESV